MISEVTFAFTVLCVLVALAMAYRHITERPMRDLWLFFLVMACSFLWLACTDVARWRGNELLATSEWRAFVHRGSICAAGLFVLWRNRSWQRGVKR